MERKDYFRNDSGRTGKLFGGKNDFYFTLYTKINSRWIKGLNEKNKKEAGKSFKII